MDMQGSKIAITLPTGQVVEYELMRSGTVREYRELLKANEQFSAALKRETGAREIAEDAAAACASHSGSADIRLAEMARERDDAKAALEIGEKMVEQKRERVGTLLSKLDTDKAALEKLVTEIMGTVDELHEGQ